MSYFSSMESNIQTLTRGILSASSYSEKYGQLVSRSDNHLVLWLHIYILFFFSKILKDTWTYMAHL